MNFFKQLILGLVFSGLLTTNALAQNTEDDRSENIQKMVDSSSANIQKLVENLKTDVKTLSFLAEKVAKAEKAEKDVLLFRMDERSFRVLADFDNLVQNITKLPEDAEQRSQLEPRLVELASDVGDAIFNRINEIKQRIAEADVKLESLSGGEFLSARAFIYSLESIRVKYYESLVRHLKNRDALQLSSEELRNRLDPKVILFAETLAGRVELNAATHTQLQSLLEQDPKNADINAALLQLDAHHKVNLGRLQTMILVLDSLKLDSSGYKTVLLQQTGSFSVNFFSSRAMSAVIKDAWLAMKSAIEANAPDFVFNLFLFVAVLYVFRIFARITRRVVRLACERSSLDLSELLKNILVSTTGGLVMGIGVLMALSQVGISLAPMLAGLGVAGFIIGFALQDTLGNFAAGAMILIYRPFDVDDFVEVTGASGLVKKMNLVSTTITTFDNQTLVVPNNKIWGDVIKNVTAQKERRVDMEFGIGYDDDVEHAERILSEIVSTNDKVLKDPAPMIHLHTLGDSSVNFIVRPWTKTENYWDVYWHVMREVKLRFDREGISIPFPQRDVHLYTEKND